MPFFETGERAIHYEVDGEGVPVLTIAPGGMRSAHRLWEGHPFDPRSLSDSYQVIGMDQRNAGASTAPVSGNDGWATYTADQLALLDHLGVERCHLVGMCIGGPYIVGLLKAAPERFRSAVILQPVGIDNNQAELYQMFDDWSAKIVDAHPEAQPADWEQFRSNMWDGDFVLTATPDEMATIETPMLVAMGNDVFHPAATSREIVDRAPNAILIEQWKEPDVADAAREAFRGFLDNH